MSSRGRVSGAAEVNSWSIPHIAKIREPSREEKGEVDNSYFDILSSSDI